MNFVPPNFDGTTKKVISDNQKRPTQYSIKRRCEREKNAINFGNAFHYYCAIKNIKNNRKTNWNALHFFSNGCCESQLVTDFPYDIFPRYPSIVLMGEGGGGNYVIWSVIDSQRYERMVS